MRAVVADLSPRAWILWRYSPTHPYIASRAALREILDAVDHLAHDTLVGHLVVYAAWVATQTNDDELLETTRQYFEALVAHDAIPTDDLDLDHVAWVVDHVRAKRQRVSFWA